MADDAFSDVDASPDPAHFVRYLRDADAAPALRAYKARSYAMLGPLDGARVLDVGCGLGTDALALSARVGPEGDVIGLDRSATMLAEARTRLDDGARCRFVQGRADAMPFEDACFDAVRIDRVLIHTESPARVLGEAARVLRPGGTLVALEGDFDTLILDHPDMRTTRSLIRAWSDRYAHSALGRSLPRLIRGAGFERVEAHAHTLTFTDGAFGVRFLDLRAMVQSGVACGVLDPLSAITWWATLKRVIREGAFFAALTGVGAHAQRPR